MKKAEEEVTTESAALGLREVMLQNALARREAYEAVKAVDMRAAIKARDDAAAAVEGVSWTAVKKFFYSDKRGNRTPVLPGETVPARDAVLMIGRPGAMLRMEREGVIKRGGKK